MNKALMLILISFLVGCATIEQMNQAEITRYNQTQYEAKPKNYEMNILDRESIERPFTVIAEERDKLATVYDSEAEIISKMKEAARKIGGDALIDLETRTVDESHDWIPDENTYYKAKVIVFENKD